MYYGIWEQENIEVILHICPNWWVPHYASLHLTTEISLVDYVSQGTEQATGTSPVLQFATALLPLASSILALFYNVCHSTFICQFYSFQTGKGIGRN